MSEALSRYAFAGRIGAAEKWAHTDDRATATEAARKSAFARFEREVDPNGELSDHERELRAKHARRAHMLRLAAKSAARRRKGRRSA